MSKTPTKSKPAAQSPTKSPAKSPTRAKPNGSVAPAPMHVLSPHLVCKDASAAIAFYKKAFGAEELMRLPGQDGKLMHACVLIGGSSVMLVDEMPEMGALSPQTLKGTPVTLHLFVDNCDKAVERAVKAGATVVMPPNDAFWGDRYASLTDPFGHSWSIAHHMTDMTEAEMKAAMATAMAG